MKIQLASDLHLEHLESFFPGERLIEPAIGADLLVLAGDVASGLRVFDLFAEWPVPVLYIAGNHEFHGLDMAQTRAHMAQRATSGTVHFLDNTCYEQGGVRFLGCTLWTDYRLWPELTQEEQLAAADQHMPDHRLIHLGDAVFTPQQALAEHQRARQWLASELARPFDGKTVVITHHAPHRHSVHPRYQGNPVSAAFASELEDLLAQADLWLHGHVHDSFQYSVGHCRIIANPRGFAFNRRAVKEAAELVFENPDFAPTLLIDVHGSDATKQAPPRIATPEQEWANEKTQMQAQIHTLRKAYEEVNVTLTGLLENFPGGVSMIDRNLRFVAWNDEMLRICNFPPEVYPRDNPPTLEEAYRYNIRRGEYGPVDEEVHLKQKMDLARKFEPHQFERWRPDGSVIEIRGAAMANGGFVTTYQDVTTNVKLREELRAAKEVAETSNEELRQTLHTLRQTQDSLVQSEKLAALGALVAGIAHEINTPLGNSILAVSTVEHHTQEMQTGIAEGAMKRSHLEKYFANTTYAAQLLQRNLSRVANLVSSFKQVAVDQVSAKRREFDLEQVVNEILISLSPSLKKTAYVVVQQFPPKLIMDSFPGPLGQVLINLLNNAIFHGFDGRAQGQIHVRGDVLDEGWVRLRVQDDGVGIPDNHRNRIYEPFFTTKMGQGGSGLGLSITHNFVTGLLGGRIDHESEVGVGTCFTLILPLVAPGDAPGNTHNQPLNQFNNPF